MCQNNYNFLQNYGFPYWGMEGGSPPTSQKLMQVQKKSQCTALAFENGRKLEKTIR